MCMKKLIILFFMFGFIFLTGCENNKFTTYETIDYKEYVRLMDSDETFSLVIGSSTCSACSLYKSTMDNFISKYNINVKYIDISKLSEDEYKLLRSEINFSSTPTTIFVKNGDHTSVYDRIVGAESISNVVSRFTKMGYIEGE